MERELAALASALKGLPVRAERPWPEVWARTYARAQARPAATRGQTWRAAASMSAVALTLFVSSLMRPLTTAPLAMLATPGVTSAPRFVATPAVSPGVFVVAGISTRRVHTPSYAGPQSTPIPPPPR